MVVATIVSLLGFVPIRWFVTGDSGFFGFCSFW